MNNKTSKIIYLSPLFPFPSNSGEEHCLYEHIKEIAQCNLNNNVCFLFPNFKNKNDLKVPFENINYKIFRTRFSFADNNIIIKKALYFLSLIFSKFSYAQNKIATKEIKSEIKKFKPEVIIADTIYTFSLLPKKKNYKLVYVAHNVEHKLHKDLVKIEKNIFMKVYKYLNLYRVSKIEKEIMKKADKIVCISSSDYNYFKNIYPSKVEFLPHKISLHNERWQGAHKKTLFFCGPLYFEPNLDAVKWIAKELSPVLSEDIKIKIAGKGTDNIPDECKRDNIDFLGFVSREELLDLYKNSSAFLCPIIYGSGVKIKVTEALSFGTPILATKEALEGLDYIDIEPLIDRNNPVLTKENIESILADKNKLQKYSDTLIEKIHNYQNEHENSFEKIINNL